MIITLCSFLKMIVNYIALRKNCYAYLHILKTKHSYNLLQLHYKFMIATMLQETRFILAVA